MGSSGGGAGSGGSGGGVGGGGTGGGGGGSGGISPKKQKDALQRILSRLKQEYLAAHFTGPLVCGIANELALLKIDLTMRTQWDQICGRFGLSHTATLADVRDAIFTKYEDQESDARVLDTAKVALRSYFEELVDFNDDLLDRRGSAAVLAALDRNIAAEPLEHYLRLLIGFVIQREEPTVVRGASLERIETLARERAKHLVGRLRKHNRGRQASEADYLRHAATSSEETRWLVRALRG